MKTMFLSKTQTDLLEWTDKRDANDMILINENGEIVERRHILALLPSWLEVSPDGGWSYKTENRIKRYDIR